MSEKKIYITPQGARNLRDELDTLWRKTRREVTKQVSDAAALGGPQKLSVDPSDFDEDLAGPQTLILDCSALTL